MSGVDLVVKARDKAEPTEAVSSDLAIASLRAENIRLRLRIEALIGHLVRNTCDGAPHYDGRCMWCGSYECAQARDFLESNT